MMRRVPEVLDCWFESGSMPFAQVHYPFENREWFESHYPGDFIVEYIGQTRGWFYTLHVLATALFDRPSFNTCVSHGIVLGDDGHEDVEEPEQLPRSDDGVRHLRQRRHAVVPAQLADPARHRSGGHRGRHPRHRASGDPAADLEHVVLPVAVRERSRRRSAPCAPTATDVLDRYILAKTHDLVVDTTAQIDAYDLFAACGTVRTFLDALTNWYVRRSRDRFWAGDQDAIDTLHTVLVGAVPSGWHRCCRSRPRRCTATSPASAACT